MPPPPRSLIVPFAFAVVACGGALALAAVDTLEAPPARPVAYAAASVGRCAPAALNASAVLPGTSIAASPAPGSYLASPHTQISLLGVPASQITSVRVNGSRTGAHAGSLHAYSQGDGASFLPAKAFRTGETVGVSGTVRAGSATRAFSYRFAVATPDVLPYSREVHAVRDPAEKQHFHSEPTLEPPVMVITARSPLTAPGDIFTTPYNGPGPSGPAIFDEAGNLVWFRPLPTGTEAANLQVQQLDGRPVLSWWQGYIPRQGFGEGEEVIADSSYRQIALVRAGNGYRADLHDFHLGAANTALITAFDPVRCNLARLGGPGAGAVTDTVFQELDLGTGLVRREWHSLDHVPLTDSYVSARGSSLQWPMDYFHLNSVQQLPDGSTLISARNTSALYELSTLTGQVRTRIGGLHSDVHLAAGAATAYQHDATLQPGGNITVFDNGALPVVHRQSRGIVISVDPARRTDTVVAQYVHPKPLSSGSQGSIQLLANGDAFLGWGPQPYFSEFSPQGQLLFDSHWHGSYQSYRAYRFTWTGAPSSAPLAAAARGAGGTLTVYASWNGDTRTAAWRVLGGASASSLTPVAGAPRNGFETSIPTPGAWPYVAVQALDAGGAVLGTSAAVHP
jgi:hypothetical protein